MINNNNLDLIKQQIIDAILNETINEINEKNFIRDYDDLTSLFEFDQNFYENFEDPKNIVLDLNNWDVSHVKNMNCLFKNCKFNIKISKWNTSNVENMISMFEGAENFNDDINSQIIDQGKGAEEFAQEKYEYQPIWDTSNVKYMNSMFKNAKSFDNDIFDWITSNVLSMKSMFEGAEKFNKNINMSINFKKDKEEVLNKFLKQSTEVNEVTAKEYVNNYDSNSLNKRIASIRWNTSKVEDMSFMFKDALLFDKSISDWDTSNVKTMESMFEGAEKFDKEINTSRVVVKGVIDNNTGSPLTLPAWNTDNVENMSSMFKNAKSFQKDLSHWNTLNVKTMKSMFEEASNFNQNINTGFLKSQKKLMWKTSKVEDMSFMFKNAVSFQESICNWDTSNVKTMESMFEGAENFNGNSINTKIFEFDEIKYIAWDTLNVQSMRCMFSNVINFNGDIDSWNVDNLVDMIDMFKNINNFDYTKINTKLKYLLDKKYIAWKINPDLVINNLDIENLNLNWDNNKEIFSLNVYNI